MIPFAQGLFCSGHKRNNVGNSVTKVSFKTSLCANFELFKCILNTQISLNLYHTLFFSQTHTLLSKTNHNHKMVLDDVHPVSGFSRSDPAFDPRIVVEEAPPTSVRRECSSSNKPSDKRKPRSKA